LEFRARKSETKVAVADQEGQPCSIERHIGRARTAAIRNPDGVLPMLHWATARADVRFALYVRHGDAAREYAYDLDEKLRLFHKGCDEAVARGRTSSA
jgi:hypothetical protein